MSDFSIRRLEKSDNWSDYALLMTQLSFSLGDKYNETKFEQYINWLDENKNVAQVWVIVDNVSGSIVASLSVFFETKWLHGFSKVAHLEDLVVTNSQRGLGLGRLLVDYVLDICRTQVSCYKVILDCKEELEPFYEKLGFSKSGSQMRIDI